MHTIPQVSVVLIFLNAQEFIDEAIRSVLAQTYENWELLLVDDGSTDRSTDIARSYAARLPNQIYYLEHPGHINRGMSASRNLGVKQAAGQYIAFLDSDDIWLPHKLTEQVALLEANSEAGMLYGQSLYWYSWTQNPEDEQRDFLPVFSIPTGTVVQPPTLLPMFLQGKTAVPCPSNILVRREQLLQIGGFEEQFRNMYEDQVFYAKICLTTPVLATDICWDRYRQHPKAVTAISQKSGRETAARQYFLNWLRDYLRQHKIADESVWQSLQQEIGLLKAPPWFPQRARSHLRWTKKWLLRLGLVNIK
jgi:glycosyltransferase involved in cell wall biosynthesis